MDDWVSYVGEGDEVATTVPIFPKADQDLTPANIAEMERDRFRWLAGVYTDPVQSLFVLWKDENFLMDERKALGNITLEEFYRNSVALGVLLLRREVQHLTYLCALRNLLRLRVADGANVFFYGPTSGAELEAIYNAGGFPVLVSDHEDSKWQHLAETRLLDSQVPFDTVTTAEARKYGKTHHAVLSSWLPAPEVTIAESYSSVGIYGILFIPSTNLSLGHEVKKLRLCAVSTYQTSVGVWFKPPAHN